MDGELSLDDGLARTTEPQLQLASAMDSVAINLFRSAKDLE